ncbi:MAG: hypothetical protein ACE5Z5_11910 [Candidatus Bathyarchaeia archaeon]
MGLVKHLIDKILSMQERFYPDVWPYLRQGKGNVALLRVLGEKGDNVLLKCDGSRLMYARGDEGAKHVFTCTIDTFLSILSGEETMREAITKRHFAIEDAASGEIDLVEVEKFSKGFERLRYLLKKLGLG